MQEHDQHVSPIKIPKQLVVVVVLAFVVPISLGILLSQLVTSGPKGAHEDDSAILARIQPVGQVQLAAPAGPKGQLTGEQVYGQVCKTCHEAGVLNAPKFGDKAAWAKVIAQGQATTVGHALSGIRAMPAKGGNPDLESVEVERGVVYMANKAGANWKEPAAPTTAAAPAEATPAATAATGASPQRRRLPHPLLRRPLRQSLPPRRRLRPSRTARRSSNRRARCAMARASRARRSSATRPRGRRASRPASTRSTRSR